MRMRSFLPTLALCLALFVFTGDARSETNIATIDMQKIMNESQSAQSIQKQVQEKRDQFQSEFSSMEQELSALQKALTEEKTTLPQEEFAKKRTDFEKKLADARNLVLKRKGLLDEGASKAMEKLKSEVIKIVDAVAKEKNYDMVLTAHSVISSDKSRDITAEVIERLNKESPKVPVSFQE